MSIKVASNRFIVSSLRAGFYQQLFRDISGFQELGCRLVLEAETAHAFRQGSRVEEIIPFLCNLPIREHQLIGQYYKGLRIQRTGQNANYIFERVAEQSSTYKAKALMSLAASEAYQGNYNEEHRFFTEALKTTNNLSLIVEASRCMAVVRAKERDHKQAIKEFEKIFPLIKHAAPNFYYQYLNSFAVELAEVGRLEEASNICDVILASPYAFAYPEWRETAEEIRLKLYRSRSVVSFTQVAPYNVVPLPERSIKVTESTEQPGKLLSYTDWTKKMVKEPNGNDELDFSKMSDKDKLFKIIELSSTEDITDDQLDQILDAVIRITSKRT